MAIVSRGNSPSFVHLPLVIDPETMLNIIMLIDGATIFSHGRRMKMANSSRASRIVVESGMLLT